MSDLVWNIPENEQSRVKTALAKLFSQNYICSSNEKDKDAYRCISDYSSEIANYVSYMGLKLRAYENHGVFYIVPDMDTTCVFKRDVLSKCAKIFLLILLGEYKASRSITDTVIHSEELLLKTHKFFPNEKIPPTKFTDALKELARKGIILIPDNVTRDDAVITILPTVMYITNQRTFDEIYLAFSDDEDNDFEEDYEGDFSDEE